MAEALTECQPLSGKLEGAPDFLGNCFGEAREKIVPVTIVDPAASRSIVIVMPCARARREPDLAGRRLPAHDEFAAIRELDRYHAVAGRIVGFVRIKCFEP